MLRSLVHGQASRTSSQTLSILKPAVSYTPRGPTGRRFQSTKPGSSINELAKPAAESSSTLQTSGATGSGAISEVTESYDINVAGELPAAFESSGAPTQLLHRTVRIYQPTRNTMQSGGAKGEKWRIDWDTLPGAGRWENPLMGWASSADYMQGTRITFTSKEDAVRFAEKQGWDYYVQPPTVKRIPPKNYAENYVYKPNKLRIARTK